jgi:hypothetical protein
MVSPFLDSILNLPLSLSLGVFCAVFVMVHTLFDCVFLEHVRFFIPPVFLVFVFLANHPV